MELTIASFNIRYDGQAFNSIPVGFESPRMSPVYQYANFSNAEWGERPWHQRRAPLADQVLWENPSVIGFQEVRFVTVPRNPPTIPHRDMQHLLFGGAYFAGLMESDW